jgi:hypothetical protein
MATNNNQVTQIMLNATQDMKENYLTGVNDRISFKKFLRSVGLESRSLFKIKPV